MEIETPKPRQEPFYQEEKLGDTLLPVKLLRGGVVAGRLVAPHWHTFMEILYFLEGGVELTLNAARTGSPRETRCCSTAWTSMP
jgi:hypothetical protein